MAGWWAGRGRERRESESEMRACERAAHCRPSPSRPNAPPSLPLLLTDLLSALMDSASDVDARLSEPIAKLQDSKATCLRLALTKNHTAEEVAALQAVVAEVEAHKADGVYYGTPADAPAGQAYLSELVDDVASRCHALLESAGAMGEETGRVHHALAGHHAHLAALARLPLAELRSEARQHEIARVQGMLDTVDSSRSSSTGAFCVGPDGAVPPGQAAVVDLLERCFKLARKLLVRIEKAEEAGTAAEK